MESYLRRRCCCHGGPHHHHSWTHPPTTTPLPGITQSHDHVMDWKALGLHADEAYLLGMGLVNSVFISGMKILQEKRVLRDLSRKQEAAKLCLDCCSTTNFRKKNSRFCEGRKLLFGFYLWCLQQLERSAGQIRLHCEFSGDGIVLVVSFQPVIESFRLNWPNTACLQESLYVIVLVIIIVVADSPAPTSWYCLAPPTHTHCSDWDLASIVVFPNNCVGSFFPSFCRRVDAMVMGRNSCDATGFCDLFLRSFSFFLCHVLLRFHFLFLKLFDTVYGGMENTQLWFPACESCKEALNNLRIEQLARNWTMPCQESSWLGVWQSVIKMSGSR